MGQVEAVASCNALDNDVVTRSRVRDTDGRPQAGSNVARLAGVLVVSAAVDERRNIAARAVDGGFQAIAALGINRVCVVGFVNSNGKHRREKRGYTRSDLKERHVERYATYRPQGSKLCVRAGHRGLLIRASIHGRAYVCM